MGDYFKDRSEEEQPKKKKEIELITNWDKLIATYAFENERYQHTINRDYENILPARVNLLGDGTSNNLGLVVELKRHLQMSKIGEMTIGQNMTNIMREITYLANVDTSHMELLEAHVEHYQFICESAVEMMDKLYKEVEELRGKIAEIETKEQKDLGPPLTENRKRELEEFYFSIPGINAWGAVTNPKIIGNRYTPNEMEYLRQIKAQHGIPGNQRIGVRTEAEKEWLDRETKGIVREKERTNLPIDGQNPETVLGPNGVKEGGIEKNESEPALYSPLSHKPEKKEPLYSDENPQ